MTILQLKNKISKLPDDAVVVMSSDPEGNKYSQLHQAEYQVDVRWHQGDFYEDGEIGKRVVVFYPS